MIVAMKKLTLLCLDTDREATLANLRDLGVLHIVPVTPPQGASLDGAREDLRKTETALALIGATPNDAATTSPLSPAAIVDRILTVHARKKGCVDTLGALEGERRQLLPLGDFDPASIRALTARGLRVRLYCIPAKKSLTPPQGVDVFTIREDSSGRYAVAISRSDFELAAPEIPLPARRLREVETELAATRSEMEALDREMKDAAASRPMLETHRSDRVAHARYVEAHAGMGASSRVAYLQGFCPEPRVKDVQAAAVRNGWGLAIDDPAPGDRVPTLIHNPAFIRPIESLFSFIKILPGYTEVDVSASFLFFLSIFFAMIVGDAGYGFVFLLLTAILQLKFRKAPPEPFRLLYIFSICTIAWGALSGAYFGITDIPAPLARFRLDWLGSEKNMMYLCLIIGVVHLSLAHLWNMIRFINSLQAIAQAGWVTVMISIFLLARQMILNIAFPGWYVPIAVGGFVATVVFMTPFKKLKDEWINHVMLPLTLMSNFGDVLSYLRLFALSVAGLQLAMAFNTMAKGVGFGSVGAGLGAALILFAGHTLNIVLSAISVLVHGIRLNALEFSTHFGLEWAGFSYEPFARPEGEKKQ